ncbi:ORF1269 [White spot syndrome virus]|uniref:ORF1269 n=1 Tax=White spot syndrome virus TaxID=342409 RepID=A0A2D3I599_9VIRU|nr:ORF1269 [White spot syndrome virus]
MIIRIAPVVPPRASLFHPVDNKNSINFSKIKSNKKADISFLLLDEALCAINRLTYFKNEKLVENLMNLFNSSHEGVFILTTGFPTSATVIGSAIVGVMSGSACNTNNSSSVGGAINLPTVPLSA